MSAESSIAIWPRVRREGAAYAAGVLCLGGTNALGLAIPWLLKVAIDALGNLRENGIVGVARYAGLIALAAVAQGIVRTFSRVLIFNAGRNIEYRLRRELFEHLLRLDPEFFRRNPTGDLMSRMTNDLSAVRMLFGPGILNLVNTVLVYGSGIWILVHLNPRLTVFALLPYPVLILSARLWSRVIYVQSRALQEQLGALSTTLQEDLAGIAVVKHYALETRRHDGFAAQSRSYRERALALARARGSLTPLFAVIAAVGTLIVLWRGGREVIDGRMTIGALVAFNAYLVYLSWPTIALGWILALWQRGTAAWVRVRELLATPPAIGDAHVEGAGAGAPTTPAADTAASAAGPRLEVRHLTIRRDGRAVLDDVSLAIGAGQTLAIVGPTGGGKTTLVDAFPRLLEVPRGTVFIDGRDACDLPLAKLRALCAYAPQEAFLFSATIGENVAFGIPADVGEPARAERVARAVRAAGLTPDLAVLPHGLDTTVGERGITLSGGQRQRVALARALASERPLLILDDSLSSVDAQTERDILGHLRPILRGRTSIVVSHRVAAVREADRIVVLDGGRVAEQGTHQELLRAGGVYASLYREQLASEAMALEAAS